MSDNLIQEPKTLQNRPEQAFLKGELHQALLEPIEDDHIIWGCFLKHGRGRYCVPAALLREGEASFCAKIPALFRQFSSTDDLVSPKDVVLLFHVYMLNTCVVRKGYSDWKAWLEDLDFWLQGVARRFQKEDVERVFEGVVNHAKTWFTPFIYGWFQKYSGVNYNKPAVQEFLTSRYNALLESGKPVMQAQVTDDKYAAEIAQLVSRSNTAAPITKFPRGLEVIKIVLGEFYEGQRDESSPFFIYRSVDSWTE